jgi:hypothetical protein
MSMMPRRHNVRRASPTKTYHGALSQRGMEGVHRRIDHSDLVTAHRSAGLTDRVKDDHFRR